MKRVNVMRRSNSLGIPNKQKGATLFTALVFLALMTIVSVSASKISMMDALVAGNNQRQMELYQDTSKDLKDLTTVVNLYKPMVKIPGDVFDPITGIYVVPDTPAGKEMQITDPNKRYSCGGFEGKAVSIGPSVSPCDLYDFQVKSGRVNTGARDQHNRGGGKEKPNPKKDSYL